MPTTFRRRAVLSWTALALWVFGAGPASGQGEAEALSASFRKAARRVLPAVVTVRAIGAANPTGGPSPYPPFEPPLRPFEQDGPPREAGGSGVVIDAQKGYVLTNDHVVQGASRVGVILHDGRERTALQVRRDPKSDLALLIVDGKGLTGAGWGDSDSLDTGDWVLAVGQPFGLSDTVTAGIVSGKGRGIGVAMYEDLIQTDAAINPGNSGGPLINLKGEIVGINTAIKTLRGGYEGVGFAIPAVRARRVATDLAEQGRVRRAYLGIQIGGVDRKTGERLDQPGAVAVNGVSPDSPAAEAGVIRGDVIVKLEGKPVAGAGSLQAVIEFAPIDQPLTLTIDRDGERREVKVVPKAQPESFGLPDPEPALVPGRGPRGSRGRPPEPRPLAPPEDPPAPDGPRAADVGFPGLGLRLSEPSPDLARRYRLGRPTHGLIVVGVESGGPADRGGLELGMVLTEVAGQKVETIDAFRKAVAVRGERPDLVVRVLKETRALSLVIPRRTDTKQAGETRH